ncbi:glycosyltransferase family 4 protein [Maribacter litopenaei]|uniref:Glycosyltransferase family 4 protein n=1 Tax=Maribacter litopenaei TaxID=2976127 RepID=A0ABY5YAR1_9FLAO|nr:glycosyltransferase family 4 protein [Maribacter litopenaei]UWX55006.1 glycosyltransferase family 4 protein [Maribacter litopenaei]
MKKFLRRHTINEERQKKRILWTHNFPYDSTLGGIWMFNQHEFLKDEVDLYYLNNLRNPIYFIKHLLKLRKLSKDYDIVHAQYGSAVGFITSFAKCSRILSLKGSDWYKAPNPSIFNKIRIFIGGYLTKFSIKRFDHIIVMSNHMKEQVIAKFGQLNIDAIVHPIDLEKFQSGGSKIDKKTKKVLFASVNVRNPIKRFPLAEESFRLLKNKLPEAELIVMSKIPHDEVCEFMDGMDVLLLTSTHEGWPNVVKEMLALNKPFVSTRVSDLGEIAEQTSSCFVCDDDAEQLSAALFKSLNAPEENLRKFVTGFSMKSSLYAVKEIYSKYL